MSKQHVRTIVDSKPFQVVIFVLIAVNAVTIGLETCNFSDSVDAMLEAFDFLCLVVYIVEAAMKIYAYGGEYFKDKWNLLDLSIVLLSIAPARIVPLPIQIVRTIRLFRIARVFRLVSMFKQMRVVVESIGRSIPGVLWTLALLLIVVYVFDVAGVFLFSERCPEYFGDLSTGLWSLFKVVTLEGWPDIAHGVMSEYDLAWLYFVPFIVLASLIMLNIVLGIILDTVEDSRQANRVEPGSTTEQLSQELDELRKQIETVQRLLEQSEGRK